MSTCLHALGDFLRRLGRQCHKLAAKLEAADE
jgi:hypothetical protein